MANQEKPPLARAFVRAPSTHPRTGERIFQVVTTQREWWSNDGPHLPSLPGGQNHDHSGDLENSGRILVAEKLAKEVGVVIAVGLLAYVGHLTNEKGWTSYVYAVDLPAKVQLIVPASGDGSNYVNQDDIVSGKVEMLNGHRELSELCIAFLDSLKHK